MAGNELTIQQVLDLLATNPQRIAELTADLTLAQLHIAPGRGEWSANDVLAHLRSCADMWGNAMETLPKKSWSRLAIITGAGKPLERTLFFYVH